MLDDSFPSPAELEAEAEQILAHYKKAFQENPSLGVCRSFVDDLPQIASHKHLRSELFTMMQDLWDVYTGYAAVDEWNQLVKTLIGRLMFGPKTQGADMVRLAIMQAITLAASTHADKAQAVLDNVRDLSEGDERLGLWLDIEAVIVRALNFKSEDHDAIYQQSSTLLPRALQSDDAYVRTRGLMMHTLVCKESGRRWESFVYGQQTLLEAMALGLEGMALGMMPSIVGYYRHDLHSHNHDYIQHLFNFWEQHLMENRAAQALFLGTYGPYLRELEQWDEMVRVQQTAVDYYRESGDRKNQASTLLTLAYAYAKHGEREKAVEAYEKGRNIAAAIGRHDLQALGSHGIGWVLMQYLDRANEALEHLNEAREILKTLPANEWVDSLLSDVEEDIHKANSRLISQS